MTEKMLLTQLRLPAVMASLDGAAQRLGVALSDLDADYGLVSVDPAEDLFVVRVRATQEAAVLKALRKDDPAEGIFGDPQIEPF